MTPKLLLRVGFRGGVMAVITPPFDLDIRFPTQTQGYFFFCFSPVILWF